MSKNSLIADFFARSFNAESYPRIKYCPGQRSLCMFGPIDSGGMIRWRPVRRAASRTANVLDNLPTYHHTPLAKEFVSGYWNSTLECSFGYEPLTLDCGAWNETDYRKKQIELQIRFSRQDTRSLPNSLPLGVSGNGSDCIYAMRMESGEIWLEEPDCRPFEKQADSPSAFFSKLRYQPVTEDLLDSVFVD